MTDGGGTSIVRGKERYQLRCAAGKYWLLDMAQQGSPYRSPVVMNESGAMILETYWRTGDRESTAEKLREAYEIEKQEALADVSVFLEQLQRQGIEIE